MPTPSLPQFTNVRTRVVDGQLLFALKHVGKDEAGALVKLPWIEMPPEDLARPDQDAAAGAGWGWAGRLILICYGLKRRTTINKREK